jgi:hypothetical protein
MHTEDEQPVDVICKGEQLLSKAKAVARQIRRQVRRVISGGLNQSGRQGAERRHTQTATPGDGRTEAGSATL